MWLAMSLVLAWSICIGKSGLQTTCGIDTILITTTHSHMGVDSWPELDATQDTNEMTQPLTPFVRTLDAFNPSDKAIRIVSSGGVTTALVLPGSGNLMGGEAFAFKLRPKSTLSNEDMLVQANINPEQDTKWRWMKMACGENPKVSQA